MRISGFCRAHGRRDPRTDRSRRGARATVTASRRIAHQNTLLPARMPGIVITAIGVAIVATVLYGGVLLWRAARATLLACCVCSCRSAPPRSISCARRSTNTWYTRCSATARSIGGGACSTLPCRGTGSSGRAASVDHVPGHARARRVSPWRSASFGVNEIFIMSLVLANPQMAALPLRLRLHQQALLVCLIHGCSHR